MKQWKKLLLKATVTVAMVFGGIFLLKVSIFPGNLSLGSKNKDVESANSFSDMLKMQDIFRVIAKSVMPAVVSINVESDQVVRNPYGDMFNDPFLRRFFGDEGNQGQMPREFKRKLQALGSGFIITKDGYILSNYHVVKEATKIVVIMSDNRKFNAKVVGYDAETDVALLKINANDLPVVAIGDSGESQVGDLVFAFGNPFGLSQTFTFGVISYIGRQGMTGYQHFIQTDAAVNPGNSGGPLVNLKGQVVGINTAIQSQSGGYQGISFAVPINMARYVSQELIAHGKVQRGYIGIFIDDIDSKTRKELGLAENEGVFVSKVEKNGPADKAGIQSGDIITKINDAAISGSAVLQSKISEMTPNSTIKVEIFRNKTRLTMNITLRERPNGTVTQNQTQNGQNPGNTVDFKGAQFAEATQEALDQNDAKYGVYVESVSPDSIFSGVLDEGSIVSSINNEEIKSLKDLKAFADKNKNTKSFIFLETKDGYSYYRSVEQ